MFKEKFNAIYDDLVMAIDASHKKTYLQTMRPRLFYLFKKISPLLQENPNQRILDIGPGDYFFGKILKHIWPEIVYECLEHPDAKDMTISGNTNEEDFLTHYINLEDDGVESSLKSLGQFDLILCFDVIEHLYINPAKLLINSYNILKSESGKFLLTTDNICRIINVISLICGRNIFFPIMSPLAFRHNREYTLKELVDLFKGIGYSPVIAKRFNFVYTTYNWYIEKAYRFLNALTWLPFLNRYKRHMFIMASRPAKPSNDYRPSWLYTDLYSSKEE